MSWWEVNARVEGWTQANVAQKTEAPSVEEFEAALAREEERQARKG
jgi:hypothetical protein